MRTSSEWSRRLPLLGVLASGWASLPPYTGPALGAAARAEVVDHVVPAIVLLLASLAALLLVRRGGGAVATPVLACALIAALCGLWMTATHLPLVVQAVRQEAVSWAAVLHHAVPAVAVLVLGVAWTAHAWSAAGAADGRP